MIEKGLSRNYAFNCRARAILFLIRHNFEIYLKYNLEIHGQSIPLSHDLIELCGSFAEPSIVPDDFKSACTLVNPDRDGAAYRYYFDRFNNKPFFTYKDRPEIGLVMEHYSSIDPHTGFRIGDLFPDVDYRNRRTWWDLTFHLGECQQLAHIRTQYDETLEYIIEGILLEGWDVTRLYLPMMFLIRHSLEIALKYNIDEVQRSSSLIKGQDFSQEHSLATLFRVYNDFLNRLDTTKMDAEVATQLLDFQKQYASLNDQIHILDAHSRYFRFPIDKQGNPYRIDLKRIDLVELLKLYYYTDPFITFTNNVMEEQGLIVLYNS